MGDAEVERPLDDFALPVELTVGTEVLPET
jgi:hypothetical protein